MTCLRAPKPALFFGRGNAKLDKTIVTFSLPAGHTCPGAYECKSKAIQTPEGVRIKDGPHCRFRCFAASQEASFPTTYNARRRNLDLLRAASDKAKLIARSLPYSEYYRLHVSGDFYCQSYFDAWLYVAREHPLRIFYAYTKSLPFVLKRRNEIPENLRLVASVGGRYDDLIPESGLVTATVVRDKQEAKALRLPVDHDDRYAIAADRDFALLLHGVQPKGSGLNRKLMLAQGYSK